MEDDIYPSPLPAGITPGNDRLLYAALLRSGWSLKREAKGSHKILAREGFPDFVWAFHDRDEIGPRMLARIAKRTGLRPEDV